MKETYEEDKAAAAAEMELRDGNYLLSVFASPLGATLLIEVEQKTDGRRWRGDFTARYIEEITQRAGNVKSFSNFVKMLRSATTTTTTPSSSSRSQSLHVDVLTYQDLEMLKDGRHKGNGTVAKENSSFSDVAAASDKRYLILTYITEFDRVHYPLPLLYEEEVTQTQETAAMKRCIQQLRSELESTKIRLKKYESPQLNFHQRRAKSSISSSNSEDENLRDAELMPRHHDKTNNTPHQSPDTRALQERVKVLEDKLRTESMAHKKSIATLTKKNTLLEDDARKARVAERRVTERLRDNEFQMSLLRGRLKSLNCNGSGANSHNNVRRSQRTSASPPIRGRYVKQGLLRPSSTPPAPTRSRHIDQGKLRRPSTASPTTGRYLLHGPPSLPPRSRASSPMYNSPRSTTPPPRLKAWGRSSSCPTRSSRVCKGMDVNDYGPTSSSSLRKYKEIDNWRPTSSSRLRKDMVIDYWRPTSSSHSRKDMEIEEWRQQAGKKQTQRCATPPSTTTTRTATPPRFCDGRSYEPTVRRSGKSRGGDAGVNDAVSEVGAIDSRLSALQDYLKRMNA